MNKNESIQAWIFVRGDSEGLPGKNTRMLCGKPLIAYTIEAAKKCRYIKDVFVSTDSPTIAAAAEQYGAVVPFLRPEALASGELPVTAAWRHAIEWSRGQNDFPKVDVLVSLPITTPLKTAEDITAAIDLYLESGADTVLSITPSRRHPAYDMVYRDDDAGARLILSNNAPLARHRKNMTYDITHVVQVINADFALREDNYYLGRVKSIVVPGIHALDLCTQLDFRLAEIVLTENTEKECMK